MTWGELAWTDDRLVIRWYGITMPRYARPGDEWQQHPTSPIRVCTAFGWEVCQPVSSV